MSCTMICGDEKEIFIFSETLIKIFEKFCKALVQAEIHVFDFYCIGSYSMTQAIRCAKTHGEHVCKVTASEIFSFDRGACHIKNQHIPVGSIADFPIGRWIKIKWENWLITCYGFFIRFVVFCTLVVRID